MEISKLQGNGFDERVRTSLMDQFPSNNNPLKQDQIYGEYMLIYSRFNTYMHVKAFINYIMLYWVTKIKSFCPVYMRKQFDDRLGGFSLGPVYVILNNISL